MSNRVSFARGQSYLGTNADQPPNWTFENRPPTQFDKDNVSIGDLWLDLSNPVDKLKPWILVSLEGDANSKGELAHWIQFGGIGTVETLSGDSGINPVFPDINGNINVFGNTAAGVSVSGDGINTLTITSTGGGAFGQSITGNDAVVVHPNPVDGNWNLLGVSPINVTGSDLTHTLNISSDGTIATIYHTDNGNAVPAAGILNVFGDTGVLTTTGAGNTVTVNLTPSTDGQVIIGATGLNPAWANITSLDGSVTVTNGPNTIDLSVPGIMLNPLPWTPLLNFNGGTVGLAYQFNVGYYSRLGNLVFIQASIRLTSKGTSAGVAFIDGLPFIVTGTQDPTVSGPYADGTIQLDQDVTLDPGFSDTWVNFTAGTQIVRIREGGSGATGQFLTNTNFGNNATFTFQGFYYTA